jgi:DNA-binding IscR family transcriptional regulator
VERYLTARNASLITLDEIIKVFRGHGVSQTEDPAGDAVTSFVEQVLERADKAASAVTGGISLEEAVRRVEEP